MDALTFSQWTAWGERNSIAGCNQPGVYVLGEFRPEPPKEFDPTTGAILYIGETTRRTLAYRWSQFDYSALGGKRGHSGGRTFHRTFCCVDRVPFDWLFVAAMPVGDDVMKEPHRSAYIKYTERQLIWEFVRRIGRLPPCNRA